MNCFLFDDLSSVPYHIFLNSFISVDQRGLGPFDTSGRWPPDTLWKPHGQRLRVAQSPWAFGAGAPGFHLVPQLRGLRTTLGSSHRGSESQFSLLSHNLSWSEHGEGTWSPERAQVPDDGDSLLSLPPPPVTSSSAQASSCLPRPPSRTLSGQEMSWFLSARLLSCTLGQSLCFGTTLQVGLGFLAFSLKPLLARHGQRAPSVFLKALLALSLGLSGTFWEWRARIRPCLWSLQFSCIHFLLLS